MNRLEQIEDRLKWLSEKEPQAIFRAWMYQEDIPALLAVVRADVQFYNDTGKCPTCTGKWDEHEPDCAFAALLEEVPE